MPGLAVVRPADAEETAAAWLAVLASSTPAALVLARRPVPVGDVPVATVRDGVARGAYIVAADEDLDCVLIATGTEVQLATEAAAGLRSDGVRVRVVSMPCREWFEQQSPGYRARILPAGIPRVGVEAASSFGWSDVVGTGGAFVGIDSFGLSAPADDALRERGMTVERVVAAVTRLVSVPV